MTLLQHKQLFSVLDIEFLNSIDNSINMYLLAAYYKVESINMNSFIK